MKKLFVLALLLLPALALAQNVRVDIAWPSITSQFSTPFLVANVPPNSPLVSVCHSPANQVPCTNYVTTFDSLGNPCANGSQDTPQPQPSACQATGDAQGNVGFWIPAGKYDVTVCIANTTTCFPPYTFTAGGASSSVEFDNGTCTTAQTINPANGNRQKLTLTNAQTCALTFVPPTGSTADVRLRIFQSTAGSFNGGISGGLWPAAVVPTITQTSGAVDVVSCYLVASSTYCVPSQDFR